MDKLSKYLILLILATIIVSCQNRPSEVMPRKKMESVMYDMYIAESIIDHDYQKFNRPERKEALIKQVLKKHNISEARWDTSLSWYSDNIDQYLQINDSVKARLQREQKVAQQLSLRESSLRNEFKIKDPNYIPRNVHIAGIGCERGFKFMLDSTQLADKFAEKDTLFFSFKVIGVSPQKSYSLKSMLTIEYADTTIYQTSVIDENKPYSFHFTRHIEQDTIISLNGFVNLSGNLPDIPLQIYQISLGDKNNTDSTSLIKEATSINEEMFDKPMMTKD